MIFRHRLEPKNRHGTGGGTEVGRQRKKKAVRETGRRGYSGLPLTAQQASPLVGPFQSPHGSGMPAGAYKVSAV
jgi:hypothetical protein